MVSPSIGMVSGVPSARPARVHGAVHVRSALPAGKAARLGRWRSAMWLAGSFSYALHARVGGPSRNGPPTRACPPTEVPSGLLGCHPADHVRVLLQPGGDG